VQQDAVSAESVDPSEVMGRFDMEMEIQDMVLASSLYWEQVHMIEVSPGLEHVALAECSLAVA
jgi:hypothetical protein